MHGRGIRKHIACLHPISYSSFGLVGWDAEALYFRLCDNLLYIITLNTLLTLYINSKIFVYYTFGNNQDNEYTSVTLQIMPPISSS